MYFIIYIFVIFIIVSMYRPTLEPFTEYSNYAIVIVEPRKHELLKSVIENFDKIMDPKWDLYVFHGKSYYDYANTCSQNLRRNKYLFPLNSNNLTADSYNYLFKQKDFWKHVNAEHILVFQTDAVLCKDSPFKIEDFLKYDYIGCPYDNTYIRKEGRMIWGSDHDFYGIGGLSYRNKSFMIKCIDTIETTDTFPEDVYYSNCVEKIGYKPENATILNQFCSQYHGFEKSFGVHKPFHMSNKEDFSKYCPEINILYE